MGGFQKRGPVKPRGDGGVAGQAARFARQHGEHILPDLPRWSLASPRASHGHSIHQSGMPLHQRAESRFISLGYPSCQKLAVGSHHGKLRANPRL
ncbi:MAG: hypothetical protein JWM59_1411 [Verrucomicrobiales bacterium]|nr:hypothetical protein [Verrucomicrobiales bacterium]